MTKLIFLIVLSTLLAINAKKSYSNYKVFRVPTASSDVFEFFKKLENKSEDVSILVLTFTITALVYKETPFYKIVTK